MIKLKKPTDEIFHLSVNKLVEMSYPVCEGQHPIFEKFGTRTGGICDEWVLNKNWRSFSDTEKWKYVALCAFYWQQYYEYLYDRLRVEDKIECMKRKLEEKKDDERERDFIERYIQELEKSLTTTESVSE